TYNESNAQDIRGSGMGDPRHEYSLHFKSREPRAKAVWVRTGCSRWVWDRVHYQGRYVIGVCLVLRITLVYCVMANAWLVSSCASSKHLQTRRFLDTLQAYLLDVQRLFIQLHLSANERPAPFVDYLGVLRDSKTGGPISGIRWRPMTIRKNMLCVSAAYPCWIW
ncbi:hypothetical protein C0993_005364, partial [Termitomyces sp. T159_Od127]